jgi:hypothetical protein
MVKISTFDFSRFGGLEANVVHVGADTLEDKKGETYYQVRLQTEKNAIEYQGVQHPISPGMIATVDILTNKKTVTGLFAEADNEGKTGCLYRTLTLN